MQWGSAAGQRWKGESKHSDIEVETTNHTAYLDHFVQFSSVTDYRLCSFFPPKLNSGNSMSMTTVSECITILCSALIHTVLSSVVRHLPKLMNNHNVNRKLASLEDLMLASCGRHYLVLHTLNTFVG